MENKANTKKSLDLKKLVRPEISNLKAYHAEHYTNVIKLDANENPFPLPEKIQEKLNELAVNLAYNRYPDPNATELKELLAEKWQVESGQILLGNGSDELIQGLLLAFGGPGAKSLSFPPTFSMYKILAQITGTDTVEVPLDDNFNLDMDKILPVLQDDSVKITFLCTPNNPTGNSMSVEKMIRIVENTPGLVVIDEAYDEFSGQSMSNLIKDYPHVVILRTFSKAFGLAGLRVGYMLANPIVVDAVTKVKLPYNLNAFSQEAAAIILRNSECFVLLIDEILREKEKMEIELASLSQLDSMPQIELFQSSANFLLIRIKNNGQKVAEELLRMGILVRSFGNAPGLTDCIRITVGLPEENRILMHTLKQILGELVQ